MELLLPGLLLHPPRRPNSDAAGTTMSDATSRDVAECIRGRRTT